MFRSLFIDHHQDRFGVVNSVNLKVTHAPLHHCSIDPLLHTESYCFTMRHGAPYFFNYSRRLEQYFNLILDISIEVLFSVFFIGVTADRHQLQLVLKVWPFSKILLDRFVSISYFSSLPPSSHFDFTARCVTFFSLFLYLRWATVVTSDCHSTCDLFLILFFLSLESSILFLSSRFRCCYCVK